MKLKSLLLVAGLLPLAVPAFAAPLGMMESTDSYTVVRDGEAQGIFSDNPSVINEADTIRSADSTVRLRMLDGNTALLGKQSVASFDKAGVLNLESGSMVSTIKPGTQVKSSGVAVQSLGKDNEFSSVMMEKPVEGPLQVASVDGAPAAVIDEATGEQLAVVTPGTMLSFSKDEAGKWLVQSPEVLQQTGDQGVENPTADDDQNAAGGAAAGAAGGGGGLGAGGIAAIAGGVILVGGGVGLAASPSLRESLGLSNDDDDDDSNSGGGFTPPPSSPIGE